MNDIFHGSTPTEIAGICLGAVALGLLMMTPFVWVFGRIVALREKPDRRALWTTILSYAGASLIFMFGFGVLVPLWFAPLAPVPGALIVYYWMRRDYRKGWIDDDKVPEGMILENSDWRIGVGVVVTLIVAATIKGMLRTEFFK